MERNKFAKTVENYDVNDEPIVISKHVLDLLLEQPNSPQLIALYIFYYYIAKWQRTNQIKATNSFVSKGLGFSERSVIKYKSQLIQLNLIENIIGKDKIGGKFVGHFIKVNFIWTKEKVEQIKEKQKTILSKLYSVVLVQSNALSVLRGKETPLAFLKSRHKIPPKIEEVAQYCKLRKNNVDPEKFCDFYKAKGWMIGKNKIKDWQAAVRTWEKEEARKEKDKNKPMISKYAPKYKTWDGIRYSLNQDDGEYYSKSGEIWRD